MTWNGVSTQLGTALGICADEISAAAFRMGCNSSKFFPVPESDDYLMLVDLPVQQPLRCMKAEIIAACKGKVA